MDALSKASGIYSTTFAGKPGSPLYLHESEQGELIGYCGPVTFRGTRRDNQLSLTFEPSPLKEHEKALVPGQLPVYEKLQLTLADGKWTVNGTSELATKMQLAVERSGALPEDASIEGLQRQSLLDVGDILCGIIKQIINAILDALEIEIGDSFRPMDVCGIAQDGRGFWLLGQSAPGNTFPPLFLHSIWMPYCVTDPFCTAVSQPFGFGATLGDFIYLHFSQVMDALRGADSFLKHVGINIDSFVAEVQSLHDELSGGKFAFCFLFSTHTRYMALIFLNEMGITTESAMNFPVIKTLMGALRSFMPGLSTLELRAGSSYSDTFSGRSGSFPNPLCNPPYWACYMFGTAEVTFS